MNTLGNIERYRYEEFPWHEASTLDQSLTFLKKNQLVYGLHFDLDKKTIRSDDEFTELLQQYQPKNLNALMLPKLDMGVAAANALRDFLYQDRKLKYLYLQDCGITDKCVALILEAFGSKDEDKNHTLRSLLLGGNRIGDDGAALMGQLIERNNSLFEVSLGSEITDTGVLEIAKGLSYNSTLRSLYLADNRFTMKGARVMAHVIGTHLSCNNVTMSSKHVQQQAFTGLINNLAEDEMKIAFEEAVRKNESGKWLRSKIMVVGQGRAGKTATVRSLLGIPFNPELESTVGADLKQSQTYTGNNNWNEAPKELSKFDFATDTASRIAALKVAKMRNQRAGLLKDKALDEFLKNLNEMNAKLEKKLKAEKAKKDKVKANIGEGGENRQFDARLVMNKGNRDEDISFNMWDLGGQEVFQTFHHLFITKCSIFLLCFDMREIVPVQSIAYNSALEEFNTNVHQRKDKTVLNPGDRKEFAKYFQTYYATLLREKRLKAREYLLFWLNSIKMHANGAKIMLIGTFYDQVRRKEELDRVDDFLQSILIDRTTSNLKFSVVRNHTGYFFPMNNKNPMMNYEFQEISSTSYTRASGVNVEVLRDVLEKVARNEPFVQQELSLKWVKVLDTLLAQKRNLVSYDEGYALAENIGIESKIEFDELLHFFHELGMIIHLTSTTTLKNSIIIQPQWLIDGISSVIRDKDLHGIDMKEIEKAKLTEEYELMYNEGIVVDDMLNLVWNNLGSTMEETSERMQYLLDIMSETLLLSQHEFEIPDIHVKHAKAYVVPSLLYKVNEEHIDFVNHQARIVEINHETSVIFRDDRIDPRLLEPAKASAMTGLDRLKLENQMRKMIPGLARGESGRDLGEEEKRHRAAIREEQRSLQDGFTPKQDDGSLGILLDFSPSFLPNGIFQRLLCLALLKSSNEQKNTAKKAPPVLYKSSAVIYLSDDLVLKLYKTDTSIYCLVNKHFALVNTFIQSFMLKISADVMGKGLLWNTFYEIKMESGLHNYVVKKDVDETQMAPWYESGDSRTNKLDLATSDLLGFQI